MGFADRAKVETLILGYALIKRHITQRNSSLDAMAPVDAAALEQLKHLRQDHTGEHLERSVVAEGRNNR
ncbi:hypothetical protein D3C84_1171820 [compost metagenome]